MKVLIFIFPMVSVMKYYFAPLEGVTKSDYRRLHYKYFAQADKYFIPFISPTQDHLMTARDMDEIAPERNEGIPAVPQILGNSTEHFIWAARELKAMGYKEVNFNLGCPSGTVTAKGKGSGLLGRLRQLDDMLADIYYVVDMDISIKTRLGLVSPDEFEAILEIYNKYPISELTIHPRVQKDFYKLPARPEEFEKYAGRAKAPLCYNGDIFSPADCAEISKRFPTVDALMLGRGLIRNPALIGQIKGEPMPAKSVFKDFHDELYEIFKEKKWSENAMLCHLKEIWAFTGDLFKDSAKAEKAIRKSKHLSEYNDAVREMFALELKET